MLSEPFWRVELGPSSSTTTQRKAWVGVPILLLRIDFQIKRCTVQLTRCSSCCFGIPSLPSQLFASNSLAFISLHQGKEGLVHIWEFCHEKMASISTFGWEEARTLAASCRMLLVVPGCDSCCRDLGSDPISIVDCYMRTASWMPFMSL